MEALGLEIGTLRAQLEQYAANQATAQQEIKTTVAAEVQQQEAQLKNLYIQCQTSINGLGERMEAVEKKQENVRDKGHGKSLVNPKFNNPQTLKDHKDWKGWKSDVEDYCE